MPIALHTDPFSSDEAFDALFPLHIRQLSAVHFTPLGVARTAAAFLAPTAAAQVLDVGAGTGKFCITAAHHSPGHFTGIEQRGHFVKAGNKVIHRLGLTNATLIAGNFTDISFAAYTAFYFFNSFHENLVPEDALDEQVDQSPGLYNHYTSQLLQRLTDMPPGTRLATYWLTITEVPSSYRLIHTKYNGLLKLWEKE